MPRSAATVAKKRSSGQGVFNDHLRHEARRPAAPIEHEEESHTTLMNTQPPFTAMIERHPLPGSVIVYQVVFPAVAPMLVPRPLGSANGCALLRLTNG